MKQGNWSTQNPNILGRKKNLGHAITMLVHSYGSLLTLILTVFSRANGAASRSPMKRGIIMALWLPFFILTQSVHWLCLLLDELVFPAYHQVSVRQPVFVVGVPRSGTTLLHRSLALDTENFTSMRAWEILMAPSIIEKRFFAALGKLDQSFGGFGYTTFVRMERKSAAKFNDIHPSGPFEYEEDELLLAPTFSTLALYYPFSASRELLRFARFDEEIGESEKQLLMGFYKSNIQRHLFEHGPEKRYLSKNPLATCKIAALKDTFPDAKFICCVRNPVDAVPSAMSLSSFFWTQFANDPEDRPFRDTILDTMLYFYGYPIRMEAQMTDDTWAFVKYEELKLGVEATILDLYPRFHLELRENFRARLQSKAAKARKFVSRHTYSADQYGLAPEQLQTKFRTVFDYFDYPRNEEARRR